VLEIGPGPGYFSTHIVKSLKKGGVVLLYIQQEMLDYASKRLDKRRITNADFNLNP
jgi:ubiquinone/menaquinone biosynthesis C-methylase UbiE